MKKRVPILVAGTTALLLAFAPVAAANAWSSVVLSGKPADCAGFGATGSSSYGSTQASSSTASPGQCFFAYTMSTALRLSGGGTNTPATVVTQGVSPSVVTQVASAPGGTGGAYVGGWHKFGGGEANS